MRYHLTHVTEYLYQNPVSQCYNEACLLPSSSKYQTCYKRKMQIVPEPAYYQERQDYFGNQLSYFSIHQTHKTLSVKTSSEIEVHQHKAADIQASESWEKVQQLLQKNQNEAIILAREYCLDSPMVTVNQQLREYAQKSFPVNRPMLSCVAELMSRIHEDFIYDPNFTSIATPLLEVLQHRRGVCQDFAHLAIACIRAMGLPARYVSGYLETLPPPGQARLVGADASHAWFSVYDPDMGWVDFDPTNGQLRQQQYISVACGRDYNDVTPLKGVIFGGGKHQLSVSVDVAPMEDKSQQQQQQQ